MSETINVNTEVLRTAQTCLQSILRKDISMTDPFEKSMGLSVDMEREIINMLKEIYEDILPALFTNTGTLLGAIINEFEKTDKDVASGFENIGETEQTGPTVPRQQIPGRS